VSIAILHHRSRKLDPHDLDLIKQLRVEGLTCQSIAEKFEISKAHVSRICRGQTWQGWNDEVLVLQNRSRTPDPQDRQ